MEHGRVTSNCKERQEDTSTQQEGPGSCNGYLHSASPPEGTGPYLDHEREEEQEGYYQGAHLPERNSENGTGAPRL